MLRCIKYGLNGVVLAGLLAAPLFWTSVDKSVHLVVDGRATRVTTTASDVGDVLRARGYDVTPHDLVAPPATSQVHDGMRVVLRRGRLLHLQIDGRRSNVWTTAGTVAAALGQLGYSSADFVSVSRDRRLPLTATDIGIRTPRVVTVLHDGLREQITTTDDTVGRLLNDIDVTVGPKDTLSAAPGSALTSGETLRLRRVGERTAVRIETLDHRTARAADPALREGTTKITQRGTDGRLRVVYSLVVIDGRVVSRSKLSETVLRRPQTKIVSVGTKPVPTEQDQASQRPDVGHPTAGSNKAIARELLARRGWGGAEQFSCLEQMWTRESGWRVDAENSIGAYGIPQSLPGSKMASVGADWRTNPTTQIRWGLRYIADRYGTPCDAWGFWQGHNYY